MKRILLLSLLSLSLSCGTLSAKEITVEQARQTATRFWQSVPATRGRIAPSWQLVRDSENTATRSSVAAPAYYVFDNADGPGFVIVSGDDTAMPILGYSFDTEFPAGDLPANLQTWLDGMRVEVNDARASGAPADNYIAQAWAATRAGTPVVVMETALWNQETPYNKLCPATSSGTHVYTGCTTTALAIIMRWHQWPERGSGTLQGYTSPMYGYKVPEVQLGYAYDWANMLLKYGYSFQYSDVEATAVATLMRDCAIMLQSDFGGPGTSGTSAPLERIPNALTSHMGYDNQTRFVYRHHYMTDLWFDMIRDELDNMRPVLYSGYTPNGAGHAFVIDGYTDDNYFSVNWGWGGNVNGYFLLTALNPSSTGIGGSSGGYNDNQIAVVGIQKDQGNDYIDELRLFNRTEGGVNYTGLRADREIVTGQPFTLYIGEVNNTGMRTFNGQGKIVVMDKNDQIVEELGTIDISLDPRWPAIYQKTYTVRNSIYPGYRIRLMYKSSYMSDWAVASANTETGCVWDLLIDDEYNIEESTHASFDRKTRILQMELKEGVSATLQDTGGSDYTGQCQVSGQTIRIDTSQLPAGSYRLILQKKNDRKELLFSVSAR